MLTAMNTACGKQSCSGALVLLAEEQGDGLAVCHCREMNMLGKNLFLQGKGRISTKSSCGKRRDGSKILLAFSFSS